MKQIIRVTKTNLPPHPAVGFYYEIQLSDLSVVTASDDELIDMYGYDETKPIGQQFDLTMVTELMKGDWVELVGLVWIED